MCGLWTRLLADSDPHNILDLLTDVRSLVDENLWTQTDSGSNIAYYSGLVKPRFFNRFLKVFLKILTYKCWTQNHVPQAKRFGHVNATYLSSYLNTICIKLVTPVKKTENKNLIRVILGFSRKPKIHTFYDF